MSRQRLTLSIGVLTTAAALLTLVSAPAAGQIQSPAATTGSSSSFTPATTPWGDPDLQGNFTNKDETAPFYRKP